jgi:hypothetical protein
VRLGNVAVGPRDAAGRLGRHPRPATRASSDTCVQRHAREAFGITGLPNGTYYIEIANPQHELFETSYHNDSLREVIIAGHRAAQVPASRGIDPGHLG